MTRTAKTAIVIGGYAAAIAAGVLAGQLYDWEMARKPYDTSGGMYAGGEMLQSLAAFLLVSLVPTGLWLWFLRRHIGFWNGLAMVSVAFAAAGVVAVLLQVVMRGPAPGGALMWLELFAVAQWLGVPIWLATFALCAWIAPTPDARRKLLVAVGLEAVVAVVALVHFLGAAMPF